MKRQILLPQIFCAFAAAFADPALAQINDCPLPPGRTKNNTEWVGSGRVIQAGVSMLEQIERNQELKLNTCTITPRTFNSKAIGNRNWFLYNCGRYQFVQLDSYISCQESVINLHNSLAGDSLAQSLSRAVGGYICSTDPVHTKTSLFFRDTKGIDFPLYEDKELSKSLSLNQNQLTCKQNNKTTAYDSIYEVVGIISGNAKRYVAVFRTINMYNLRPIAERVPSL